MKRGWFLPVFAVLGFAFLYAPIISLVVFSFNESRLVTVWGGFSTQWYGELFADGWDSWQTNPLLAASLISLKVAAIAASIATVIGTLAAFVLTRFGKFRGKLLLTGMITAPLVMPEVIIGLSLLLLFVSMEMVLGWPAGRGLTTVVIAHGTFCAAYVAVIAQSRLRDMDESLEEAARDLGAGPVRVFFDITLPVIAPALVSGWLLAFTLSL
ncbi:MAG: ABC transporter permease subunit, partial [Rhodobacteraceae bacterium]|nr:ABC transporter permease subunit [Paracoccaceae bacterium]